MNAQDQLPPNPGPSLDLEDDEGLDLGRLVAVVSEARWLVGGIAVGVLTLGLLYAFVATPIYRTDSDLLVLAKQSGGLSGLEDFSAMLSGSTLPTETEIQLLQTRAVLVPVIQTLHLDLSVTRAHWPLIGRLFGPHGAPKLAIAEFHVPSVLEGRAFDLERTGAQTFRLLGPDGDTVLDGRLGIAVSGRVTRAEGDGVVTMRLDSFGGETGHFEIARRPIDTVVKSLLASLSVAEVGTQTGMVRASLEGPSPAGITRELNAIAQENVHQNARRSALQAARQLQFLKTQLPDVENSVEDSQKKLSDYLSTHHTLVISQDATYLSGQAAALEQQIGPLQAQIAEAKAALGSRNPQLATLRAQLSALEAQRAQLFAGITKLPKDQQTLVRLQSDVTIAQTLYQAVLNQMQTLQITQAGALGDVVIVDPAIVPVEPIRPNRPLILAVALMAGLLSGVGAAFARRALHKGIEDPEALDVNLGLPVYAVIAHSRMQTRLAGEQGVQMDGTLRLLTAAPIPQADAAIEGLKSLRTAIQLDLAATGPRVICLSSLGPGEGKSFVSANLAYLFAQSGLQVLLIDADMRRGHLHKAFGLGRVPGLAEILAGDRTLVQSVHKTQCDTLDFLATGAIPEDAANLLVSADVGVLIAQACDHYDLVMIDVPPVLAVSDAFLIGRHASMNLLLLKHGLHSERQVQLVQKRFQRHGITLSGSILNDVTTASQRYAYYQYGYRYQYNYKSGTDKA